MVPSAILSVSLALLSLVLVLSCSDTEAFEAPCSALPWPPETGKRSRI